jgi:hypothetical protein
MIDFWKKYDLNFHKIFKFNQVLLYCDEAVTSVDPE